MAIKYNPVTGDFEEVEEPRQAIQRRESIPDYRASSTSNSLTRSQRTKIARLSQTLKETYNLIQEGKKTVKSLARARDLTESTIYSHLSSLVSDNLIKASDFISTSNYNAIKYVLTCHQDASLKDLFHYMAGAYDYGQIKLVQADLGKGVSNSATSNSCTLAPVSRVNVLKESSPMFDVECTLAITSKGYFLKLNGMYYKLADLLYPVRRDPGQIWRMRPQTSGYEYMLVHFVNSERYQIGEIKKVARTIKFKPIKGSIITIPL